MKKLTDKQKKQKQIAESIIVTASNITNVFNCDKHNESEVQRNKRIAKYTSCTA